MVGRVAWEGGYGLWARTGYKYLRLFAVVLAFESGGLYLIMLSVNLHAGQSFLPFYFLSTYLRLSSPPCTVTKKPSVTTCYTITS